MKRWQRLLDQAEGLGYHIHKQYAGHWTVTHPNQPDEQVKINTSMAEGTARKVERKLNILAGLGNTGPADVQQLKDRARITRQQEKAQQARQDEARERRAQQSDLRRADIQRTAATEHRRRSIERLMMPGDIK